MTEEDIFVKYDDGEVIQLDGDIEIIPDDPTKDRMILKRKIMGKQLPPFMRLINHEDLGKFMKDLDWFFTDEPKKCSDGENLNAITEACLCAPKMTTLEQSSETVITYVIYRR